MLKQKYAKQDDIPEEHRDLYTQVRKDLGDDAWYLDSEDAKELRNTLAKYKEADEEKSRKIRELEEAVGGAPDPEEYEQLRKKLQEIEDKAAADAAGTEPDKIEQLVMERSERMRQRHQEELEARDKEIQRLRQEVADAQDTLRQDRVGNEALNAALSAGAFSDRPAVHADIKRRALETWRYNEDKKLRPFDENGELLRGEDGVSPITFQEWAETILKRECAHYFPAKSGVGSENGQPADAGDQARQKTKKFLELPATERLAALRANPTDSAS